MNPGLQAISDVNISKLQGNQPHTGSPIMMRSNLGHYRH